MDRTGDKMPERGPEFICLSDAGAVVPDQKGGSRTLRKGDTVRGEYYVQVAERIGNLVDVETVDSELLEHLDETRRRRNGETFHEDFKAAMEGAEKTHNPRFDKGIPDAAENLRRVIREESGKTRAAKGRGRG
jgi:hypothetical protein